MNSSKYIIYLISFLDLFSVGLVVPLLGAYLKTLDISYSAIGVISSVYSATQILSGPIVGAWSDNSNRKNIFISILIVCGFLYLILGFVKSVTLIFLIRFLLGLFKHTQSVLEGFIADIYPAEIRTEIVNRSVAHSSVGFILGPLLGGYISEHKHGFSNICILASLIFFMNAGLVSCLPDVQQKKSKNSSRKSVKISKIISDIKEINWVEYWNIFLVRFLFALATALFLSNQSLYLKEYFHLPHRNIGQLISFFSLITTASMFLTPHLNYFYVDDFSCFKRLYYNFLVLTVSLVSLYFSNIFIYALFLVPFAISSGALRVVSLELLLKTCDNRQVGTCMGVSSSIMSAARFIAPAISGWMLDIAGSYVMMLPWIPAIFGTIVSYLFYAKIFKIVKKS